MNFSQKVKAFFEKGVSATKDLVARGALKVRNAELKSRVDTLFSKLGVETYNRLADMDQDAISRESPIVVGILQEIKALREKLEQGEKEYLEIGVGQA